jgi:general secretion pathway protein C
VRKTILLLFLLIGLTPLFLSAQTAAALDESKSQLSSCRLMGIVWSTGGRPSSAILQNRTTGKSTILSEGENWHGYLLSRVLGDGVVFRQGEKTYWVALEQTASSAAGRMSTALGPKISAPEAAAGPAPTPPAEPDFIRREFKRTEVEKKLPEEMISIYQEMRFMPCIVEGKVQGFRITQLPRIGLIAELGIQVDDILVEINGTRLADVGDLLSLYTQLRSGNGFELVLERGGRPIHCFYSILND